MVSVSADKSAVVMYVPPCAIIFRSTFILGNMNAKKKKYDPECLEVLKASFMALCHYQVPSGSKLGESNCMPNSWTADAVYGIKP